MHQQTRAGFILMLGVTVPAVPGGAIAVVINKIYKPKPNDTSDCKQGR